MMSRWQNASAHGYYDQMLEIIRAIMSTALKDNSYLQFAVITGCLKISKESIFTGTNNFISDTITDSRLNEYFGFTQKDVEQILADTGHQEKSRSWFRHGMMVTTLEDSIFIVHGMC